MPCPRFSSSLYWIMSCAPWTEYQTLSTGISHQIPRLLRGHLPAKSLVFRDAEKLDSLIDLSKRASLTKKNVSKTKLLRISAILAVRKQMNGEFKRMRKYGLEMPDGFRHRCPISSRKLNLSLICFNVLSVLMCGSEI